MSLCSVASGQQIWVTNVGDLATQEYCLGFFLDMAYDMEKYGGKGMSETVAYTENWMKTQFGSIFGDGELKELSEAYWNHLELLMLRKHEVMNADILHPTNFGEADDVIIKCDRILEVCTRLKEKCPVDMLAAFVSLIHYPVCGTANLFRMWILAGKNRLYAKQNRNLANTVADEIERCMDFDDELTREYHSIANGKFDGFGLGEHIGFRNWDDRDNQYPLRTYVRPANEPRMIITKRQAESYHVPGGWANNNQVWREFLRPDINEIEFENHDFISGY